MKNRMIIRSMVFDSLILALIMVFTYVPFIGFITLGPISFTTIHVFVLIGAYFGGIKKGWVYGLMFGFASFLKAVTMPAGVLDPLFVNPLVSILPRIIFGFLAGALFSLLKDLKDKSKLTAIRKEILFSSLLIISLFGLTLLHSLLTLGSLAIFEFTSLTNLGGEGFKYWPWVASVFVTGSIPEGALAAIVCAPTIAGTYNRYLDLMNK